MRDLALAILRAGRSYDEAAKCSGLSVAAVMKLWERMNNTVTKEGG